MCSVLVLCLSAILFMQNGGVFGGLIEPNGNIQEIGPNEFIITIAPAKDASPSNGEVLSMPGASSSKGPESPSLDNLFSCSAEEPAEEIKGFEEPQEESHRDFEEIIAELTKAHLSANSDLDNFRGEPSKESNLKVFLLQEIEMIDGHKLSFETTKAYALHIQDKKGEHEMYLVIKEKTTTTATIDSNSPVHEIEKDEEVTVTMISGPFPNSGTIDSNLETSKQLEVPNVTDFPTSTIRKIYDHYRNNPEHGSATFMHAIPTPFHEAKTQQGVFILGLADPVTAFVAKTRA